MTFTTTGPGRMRRNFSQASEKSNLKINSDVTTGHAGRVSPHAFCNLEYTSDLEWRKGKVHTHIKPAFRFVLGSSSLIGTTSRWTARQGITTELRDRPIITIVGATPIHFLMQSMSPRSTVRVLEVRRDMTFFVKFFPASVDEPCKRIEFELTFIFPNRNHFQSLLLWL